MLVKECYLCGAKEVTVDWSYDALARLHNKYCSDEVLGTVKGWEEERLKYYRDTLPVRIYIESDDPDGLFGIDQAKMARAQQKRYEVVKPYRDAMEGRYQWCIAAVPGAKWAKKVFPEMRKSAAIEALWEKILSSSRALNNPTEAWEKHNKELKEHCAHLNSLGIKELIYKSSNGTDLRVGMMPEARFCGGDETALGSGIVFNPNIPTEECFISPKKGLAEGTVVSTKPLSYQGQLIENFSFTFKDGKVVSCNAEKNESLLKEMINMDEGASYLGECAIVPQSSPINRAGILFYNTLFDENACCHLALGMGFIDTIADYDKYTLDEMHKMGVNDSMIHVDFMIGADDLSIEAICEDGHRESILKNGEWAF